MKSWYYFELKEFFRSMANSGIISAHTNLKKALELNGVEVVEQYSKDIDVFHVHYPIGFMTQFNRLKFYGKIPLIVHAHSTAEDLAGSFVLTNEIKPITKKMFKFLYSKADTVLCPSPYGKRLLESYGVTGNIEVISNGIDTDFFRSNPDPGFGKGLRKAHGIGDEPVVFSVGHVIQRKGCLEFAHMAEQLPECRFMWFGQIYSKFIAHNLELMPYINGVQKNLKFAGYAKDILEAYAAGDIFVFPTYEEMQGIAVLEAAAMEKPIIVRDLPVFQGWLEHGVNCLKAKTTEEFVEHIETLVDDRQLRQKLVDNAKKLAEENSLRNTGKKLKGIYERVVRDYHEKK